MLVNYYFNNYLLFKNIVFARVDYYDFLNNFQANKTKFTMNG